MNLPIVMLPPTNDGANFATAIAERAVAVHTNPAPAEVMDPSGETPLSLELPGGIQPALIRKLYFGIDNGFTGAIARIGPQGAIACQPVAVTNLGGEKLLDIDANLAILQRMIAASGVASNQVLVVFEQGQIAPKFGARNNYTNGKNNEFWRVALSLAKIPFAWVNPKNWQKSVFRGIRGTDTKAMAELVCRQRFPGLDLRPYNQSQREGINDAICIALWAQQTLP
jgi:hypothetical protein